MKKSFTIFIAAIMMIATLFVGCSNGSQSTNNVQSSNTETADTSTASSAPGTTTGKTYKIKLGYVQNDADPLTQGLYHLAEKMKERTNGEVEIEVFPSGLLGDTADVVEQCKTGAAIGLLTDAGRFSDYIPEIGILDAPYLFDTYEEGNKIVQSDMFIGWTDRLVPEGFRVCSFNWYQGARHYLTVKPIASLADVKDMKIRTGGSPVWQATINAFGSKATSLAQNDVYAGIQGKVVDGAEQQITAVYGLNLYEVSKHYALTNHFQLLTGLVVSEKWFQSLPEDYRQIFIEESIAAGQYASNLTIERADQMLSEMQEKGLTVVEVDTDEWKAASEKVYHENAGFEDIRTQIKEILGK